MPNDYIGAIIQAPGDLKQYGVPGMKWGVRKDRATRKAEAAKREQAKTSTEKKTAETSTSSTAKTTGNIQDRVESSADRYARLSQQAKEGRASEMTEQDLKFFNARTEALAKVQKMNEENPSWLAETSKKVVQRAAEQQMQNIANSLANKYIGDPITSAIKGSTSGGKNRGGDADDD